MTPLEQIKKEGETRLVRKLETHGCATNTIANALVILRSTVDSVAQAAVTGRDEELLNDLDGLKQYSHLDFPDRLVRIESVRILITPPTPEKGTQTPKKDNRPSTERWHATTLEIKKFAEERDFQLSDIECGWLATFFYQNYEEWTQKTV